MHGNRLKYTLAEYQSKIERSAKSFSMILKNKEDGKDYFLKPVPKSMWHPKFQREYLRPRVGRLMEVCKQCKLDFLTLTYRTSSGSPEQIAERHKKDINEFFKKLRKKVGAFRYSYIVEVTKKHYVHFHIFISRVASEYICRKVWRSITKSWIVKLVHLDSSYRAIGYVNKYLAKIADGDATKLEFMYLYIDRFFGTSQGFFSEVKKKDNKGLYSLVSNLFINPVLLEKLQVKGLEGELVPADQITEMLLKLKLGFLFVFNGEKTNYMKLTDLETSDEVYDFYYDFMLNRNYSFSDVYDNEINQYWTYNIKCI